ncbi:MAG: hypothetical protein ACRCVG_04730 [Methanobacteriaceae archaeon]
MDKCNYKNIKDNKNSCNENSNNKNKDTKNNYENNENKYNKKSNNKNNNKNKGNKNRNKNRNSTINSNNKNKDNNHANIYNNRGQLSMEMIFIVGFLFVLVFTIAITFNNENELNIAMSSARAGVLNAITIDGTGIFQKKAYEDYESSKSNLTTPNSIRLVKIVKNDLGYHSTYKKYRIQFKVYLSSNDIKTTSDRNSISDRVNLYVRKGIADSFPEENSGSTLYNPSFSKRYVFTTAGVGWI